MIPLWDERLNTKSRPYVTYIIIIINLIAFYFETQLAPSNQYFFTIKYGVVPNYFFFPANIPSGVDIIQSLVTYMFFHASVSHLLFNMLYLYIFGDNVEALFGKVGFIIFYLVGGFVAAISHIAFVGAEFSPLIGASGAIAALMGAYIVFFPLSRITTLIIIFPVRIYAFFYLGIWIVQQYLLAQTSTEPVAFWAHIGGFVFGGAIALLLRLFIKIPEYEESKN